MSPGVSIPSSNLKPELELVEEPASLAALEESLGQFTFSLVVFFSSSSLVTITSRNSIGS